MLAKMSIESSFFASIKVKAKAFVVIAIFLVRTQYLYSAWTFVQDLLATGLAFICWEIDDVDQSHFQKLCFHSKQFARAAIQFRLLQK